MPQGEAAATAVTSAEAAEALIPGLEASEKTAAIGFGLMGIESEAVLAGGGN